MNKIKILQNQLKQEYQKQYKNCKTKQEVIELWQQDKRRSIPSEVKQMFCLGCRNNFYNGHMGGSCWSLSKSKLKKRKIHRSLDSVEPEEKITLNCYIQKYK